jgi:hypothetical protein
VGNYERAAINVVRVATRNNIPHPQEQHIIHPHPYVVVEQFK